MSNQTQNSRRQQVLEVIYPNKHLLRDAYDKKKLEEYKVTADARSNFTDYEMNHINQMYERIMKAKYGIGADTSKHDAGRSKLRFGNR